MAAFNPRIGKIERIEHVVCRELCELGVAHRRAPLGRGGKLPDPAPDPFGIAAPISSLGAWPLPPSPLPRAACYVETVRASGGETAVRSTLPR